MKVLRWFWLWSVILVCCAGVVIAQGEVTALAAVNVNIRAEPGIRSTKVGLLAAGTTVTVTGRNERADWVFITGEGIQGWVARRYLRLPRGFTVSSLPVVTGQTVIVNQPPAPAASSSGTTVPAATASTNFIVMPPSVIANSKTIFQRGRTMGNAAGTFIKIGDSNMVWSEYLCPFNGGSYDLGGYTYLQGIINVFQPSGSFCANNNTAQPGFVTGAVLDAFFVTDPNCRADEVPLTCELRLRRPAFALFYIGVLDMNFIPVEAFAANMHNIVNYLSRHGVISILSTFALDDWRHDGRAVFYNDAIRRVAASQQVPLMDLQAALYTYPGRGTREDGYHLSVRDPNVITFTGDENIYGRTKRELLTLELLNSLYWQVNQ